jgi:hypothetical protein
VKYTTTVIISSGSARLIRMPSAPTCTSAYRNVHNAIAPKPRYVSQITSSATTAKPKISAAANP